MSRIGELIAEHCPNGVPYLPIGSNRVSEKVVAGATPRTGRSEFWDGGTIPWMSSGEVNKGTIYETDQLITHAAYEATSTKMIPAGSVVMALAGQGKTRGTVARTRIELCTNQSLASIVVSSDMDSDFLYYFLQTQYKKLRDVSSGEGTRGGLNLQMIRSYKVPVPPLEVQREIVRVLDTFSKMEEELEAELEEELEARKQQYEHYRSSLLAESAASGTMTELGQLGRIITGRTPKASDVSAWGDDVDFITPSDIKNGMKIINNPTRHLSKSGAESLSKTLIPERSLLVTCIGADMGKTVININKCATNQQINSIILNSGIDTDFVFHVLTSMRDKIRAQGERAGGTMPIINKSDFSKIEISIPPLSEQERIASILNKFDELVNDLSGGLPAELTARRQQYEYYRDKLLRFRGDV